jgi:hypothetical protein
MVHIALDIALHLVVLFLYIQHRQNPNSALSQYLWGRVGPRTDTRNMSSTEIYGAARFFLCSGFYALGLSLASFYLLNLGSRASNRLLPLRYFLFILPVFFMLMGFVGAAFLFIAALYKKDELS